MLTAIDSKARTFDELRDVLGYIENGGGTTVRIYQDDATQYWTVAVGPSGVQPKYYCAPTLAGAIREAHKAHHELIDPIKD